MFIVSSEQSLCYNATQHASNFNFLQETSVPTNYCQLRETLLSLFNSFANYTQPQIPVI